MLNCVCTSCKPEYVDILNVPDGDYTVIPLILCLSLFPLHMYQFPRPPPPFWLCPFPLFGLCPYLSHPFSGRKTPPYNIDIPPPPSENSQGKIRDYRMAQGQKKRVNMALNIFLYRQHMPPPPPRLVAYS